MKKLVKISLVLVAMIAFGATSFAQNTANASANSKAKIIAGINITNDRELNFGDIIADATGGTVIVDATNPGARSASPVTLISAGQAGTVSSAHFTVTGQAGYTYTIDLPSSDVTLQGPAGSTDMTIAHGTFTSSLASPATFSAGGSDDLYIGATLTVGGSQDPGVYESGSDFVITVTYE